MAITTLDDVDAASGEPTFGAASLPASATTRDAATQYPGAGALKLRPDETASLLSAGTLDAGPVRKDPNTVGGSSAKNRTSRPTSLEKPKKTETSERVDGMTTNYTDIFDGYRGQGDDKSNAIRIIPSDDRIALIRLVKRRSMQNNTGNGKQSATLPAYVDLIPPISRFFLSAATDGHDENFQISQNNKDWNLYMFGERPRVETYSGSILNAKNHTWLSEFLVYYNNFLRGTRAAELGAEVILSFEEKTVRGALLSMRTQKIAESPHVLPLSFTMAIFKEFDQNAAAIAQALQGGVEALNKKINLDDLAVEQRQPILDALAALSSDTIEDNATAEIMIAVASPQPAVDTSNLQEAASSTLI